MEEQEQGHKEIVLTEEEFKAHLGITSSHSVFDIDFNSFDRKVKIVIANDDDDFFDYPDNEKVEANAH